MSTPVSPGCAEGMRGVPWHQEEVALPDGDDPLPGQDVVAAFDDEEDLGRAGVVAGGPSVPLPILLRAHCFAGRVTVGG
jgi:hypothetical protein